MLNVEKHSDFLVKILKDIYLDKTLAHLLGFKGGTAAMLFYELPRFSVDLDFDLLDVEKEDVVFEKVGKIVAKYGKMKDQSKKFFTLFFKVSYGEQDHNIKIEINRRSFGSQYEIKNYLGIAMKVMVQEDMFANKLAALHARIERASRDIFDVWYFLQNGWPINKKMVEERTGLTFDETLLECIKKLERIADTKILFGLGELLTPQQKSWAKAKLKQETLFLMRMKLDNENKNKK